MALGPNWFAGFSRDHRVEIGVDIKADDNHLAELEKQGPGSLIERLRQRKANGANDSFPPGSELPTRYVPLEMAPSLVGQISSGHTSSALAIFSTVRRCGRLRRDKRLEIAD